MPGSHLFAAVQTCKGLAQPLGIELCLPNSSKSTNVSVKFYYDMMLQQPEHALKLTNCNPPAGLSIAAAVSLPEMFSIQSIAVASSMI